MTSITMNRFKLYLNRFNLHLGIFESIQILSDAYQSSSWDF